ncbi:MAG TPA: HNH endonuclease signature motif containing protein [Bacteriovoracaceae bacterium]|nr:HNH endonuclease signature motif containing protein [Bacteriovoracaceae bacterium]
MYQTLSNKLLHKETVNASKSEKAATVILLKFLFQVSSRKMFLDYGHSTLHKYVMHELGYSESEAWTRIGAMKLVATVPGVEEKIESGDLNLFSAAVIQSHIQNGGLDPKSDEVKAAVKQAEEVPTRRLKQVLNPDAPKDKKVSLNQRVLDKIKQLQKSWGDTTELEIFEALLDEKIKELELNKSERTTKADPTVKTRYIPISTKRDVLQRSRNQCEYVHPNGKRCDQRRFLEFDHVEPYALGGDRSLQNIRILCRNHNQKRSYTTFGYNPLKYQRVHSASRRSLS